MQYHSVLLQSAVHYSRTCRKPELKDLVTYRKVTSQEAQCFERWPGLNGADGDSRTLQSLCFYSRTPMTSQAVLALFPSTQEFRICIVSVRTFWTLYTGYSNYGQLFYVYIIHILHIELYYTGNFRRNSKYFRRWKYGLFRVNKFI